MLHPLKCTRCGATNSIQPSSQLPARNLPPFPQPPLPHSQALWLIIAGLGILGIALAILIPAFADQSQKRAQERFWIENSDRFITLKSDAERLVIAGKLAEAHAVYRQMEQLIGVRSSFNPRSPELVERAKQDQDRLYSMILNTRATVLNSSPPASSAPPAQYRGFNQAPVAAATRPDSPSPRALLAAAMRAPAPTTRQIARPPVVSEAPASQPAVTRPAPAAPDVLPPIPPIHAVALQPPDPMDRKIDQAIQRGADFLVRYFEANPFMVNNPKLEGRDALCVYALLQASQTIQDPRLNPKHRFMAELIDRMKQHNYGRGLRNSRQSVPCTYATSLRILALSVYNRPEDRQTLLDDVNWLIVISDNGAYTYNGRVNQGYGNGRYTPALSRGSASTRQPQPAIGNFQRNPLNPLALAWDNSNSQYGLLGVWAGAEVGAQVPLEYWSACERHWVQCQLPDGGWNYTDFGQNSSVSMTAAGVASLFVTHDYLNAPHGERIRRQPLSPALVRGLAWIEQGDSAFNILSHWMHMGYTLYGLERVGLASGFKYFGTHDWYRELATGVLKLQRRDGAFAPEPDVPEFARNPDNGLDNAIINTAYTVLFLARGRHPVMINKLCFPGAWANRPRDIANLSKFASRELERPLNWQVVNLQVDWTDWLDSPILYLASHQAARLQPADIRKLRSFAEAGGLIFTHADDGDSNFNSYIEELAKQLFPDYELTDLPPTHELYSLMYEVLLRTPQLRVITNGSRLLLVHSPTDLAGAWQVRDEHKLENWQLAMNLFVYAAGKTDYRNRLNTLHIPPTTRPADPTIRFARLRYPTAWNPEPYAFERFNRYLRQHTSLGLDLVTLDVRDLKPESPPIAHMTGNVPYTPSDAEIAALRNYVQAGGILLIDSCGGSERFSQSVATILQKLAPTQKPTLMDFKHRLFTPALPAMDELTTPQLRPYAKIPAQFQILPLGKGTIIATPLDLTTGLLGTNTWCIVGYKPDYAQKFVKNLVLWAADGAKP